jgi:hypothetical protein
MASDQEPALVNQPIKFAPLSADNIEEHADEGPMNVESLCMSCYENVRHLEHKPSVIAGYKLCQQSIGVTVTCAGNNDAAVYQHPALSRGGCHGLRVPSLRAQVRR